MADTGAKLPAPSFTPAASRTVHGLAVEGRAALGTRTTNDWAFPSTASWPAVVLTSRRTPVAASTSQAFVPVTTSAGSGPAEGTAAPTGQSVVPASGLASTSRRDPTTGRAAAATA